MYRCKASFTEMIFDFSRKFRDILVSAVLLRLVLKFFLVFDMPMLFW